MATQVGQWYLCEMCGAKVEVKTGGIGTVSCCSEPMRLIKK